MTGRLLKSLAVMAALLALGGCTTLGPDYREPEISWLSDWQPDLYGQVGKSEVDPEFWWHLFDDPVLNGLVETARKENPTLRLAGLRILESRAVLGIAGSSLYPQSQTVGANVSYVNNKQRGGTSLDRNQSLTSYQAGFNLGWELDFWGKFQRGIESADASFFGSIANYQDAQVLLSAQVASLYFNYRTFQQRIIIARENAAIQKRSFDITREIYASGQDSELDLQQAKSQYLATLSSIPNLELNLIKTRNALAAILGRPPGDLPELDGKVDNLPEVAPLAIEEIPASLLLRRPDIRAAAWQVAAQSAQIGIAEADFYPAVTLLGSIGWSGNTLSASPDTTSLVIGPGVSWNIFDHGRIANNVRLQDARLQELIANYQNSVLLAARDVDDAAISIVKTAEQRKIRSESVKAAKRSLELANTNYREGYADFQRVLDAQRSLFSQTENELSNHASHIAAIIDLYKALGGGWRETPVQQLIPEDTRKSMQERTDWGDLLTAPLPAGDTMPVSGTDTMTETSQ